MAEENIQEETQVTEPEQTTTEPNQEQPTETQDRARRMGWRPREEFKGPEYKWVPAEQFLERGEAELPVLRERFRSLDDKYARLEKRYHDIQSHLKDQTQVLVDFREFSLKNEERAYNKAKRELERDMRDATAMADTAKFDQAKVELDNLERTKPVEPPKVAPKEQQQATPEIAPEIREWVEENSWFNRDPVLGAVATQVHGEFLKEHPGMSLRENLAEVTRYVQEKFPEKFGIRKEQPKSNPNRDKPSTVSTSSASGSAASGNAKKGKGYNDLPKEARDACDKYVKEIPNYSRDEYVKMYFAGEDE